MIQQNSTRPALLEEACANLVRAEDFPTRLPLPETTRDSAFIINFTTEGEAPEEEGDESLDDAARDEREYLRRRLREDLGREPSEEEVDEWLRRHTEGY